ncbi:heterokaryon incompatibility protein-domain-containing protein, partial [Lasiosphaeris hirsuta]
MRLINTATLEFTEFIGSQLPAYGILSHTWEAGEATFEDAQAGLLRSGTSQGFHKVRKACELARDDGLDYCWADTCCIDKSSSSELTEAINSMFQWYASADVCFAFLSDLAPDDGIGALAGCRWFTRGWTLQELIAPRELRFYDRDWVLRGTKGDHAAIVSEITLVGESILLGHKALNSMPVGRRMSWAAGRQTTRPEDKAYCLLGIFDVNMPLIYGEGQRAFTRLQDEIIRQSNDLSIFLWTSTCGNRYRGILAESPDEFKCAANIVRYSVTPGLENPEYIMTNKGVRINISLS